MRSHCGRTWHGNRPRRRSGGGRRISRLTGDQATRQAIHPGWTEVRDSAARTYPLPWNEQRLGGPDCSVNRPNGFPVGSRDRRTRPREDDRSRMPGTAPPSIRAESPLGGPVNAAIIAGRAGRLPRPRGAHSIREERQPREEVEDQIHTGPLECHAGFPYRRCCIGELIVSALDIRAGRELRSVRITSPRHQAVESQSRNLKSS